MFGFPRQFVDTAAPKPFTRSEKTRAKRQESGSLVAISEEPNHFVISRSRDGTRRYFMMILLIVSNLSSSRYLHFRISLRAISSHCRVPLHVGTQLGTAKRFRRFDHVNSFGHAVFFLNLNLDVDKSDALDVRKKFFNFQIHYFGIRITERLERGPPGARRRPGLPVGIVGCRRSE